MVNDESLMFGKKQSWPNEYTSIVLLFCQELKKINELSVEIVSVLPSFEPGTLQIQYALKTLTLTKRDRKQLNIFERKVYRGILGPVHDNGKENWRILTNKEIYAILKKPAITETVRLHRLHWVGHVQRMEENRIPKRVLYMNLETTRPRGRPRNRWQDEVMKDGRMVGGEEWQEKVYDREEWKKLLSTARNRRILHVPME
jgi:hypothetical protein